MSLKTDVKLSYDELDKKIFGAKNKKEKRRWQGAKNLKVMRGLSNNPTGMFGMNPHPKIHSRKYWQDQIKKNPNKVITIIINYEKIIVKIIKMKMLGWGYRPSLEHSPIKLSKGKIKFKTRRKQMTKAEKKKFLARLNKGRKKAGLKPIRAKK